MMNRPIQIKTLISVIMMKCDEVKRNELCGKQFIENLTLKEMEFFKEEMISAEVLDHLCDKVA